MRIASFIFLILVSIPSWGCESPISVLKTLAMSIPASAQVEPKQALSEMEALVENCINRVGQDNDVAAEILVTASLAALETYDQGYDVFNPLRGVHKAHSDLVELIIKRSVTDTNKAEVIIDHLKRMIN